MVQILFLNRLFVNEMLILKSSYLQGFLSLSERFAFSDLEIQRNPFRKQPSLQQIVDMYTQITSWPLKQNSCTEKARCR